jgi:DNA-binding IscR family transcriptional regulator
MKLTSASRSAVRALAHLAGRPPGACIKARDIAREAGARQITLLATVEATDGPVRGDAPPVDQRGRPLQAACDEAAALVRQRLARVTLADLARGK